MMIVAGLVAKVFEHEKLLEEAIKSATVIASYSLPSVMMCKEAVNKCMYISIYIHNINIAKKKFDH
jgi:enoyl-CoA hydratase